MKRISSIIIIVMLAACTFNGKAARKNARTFAKEALGVEAQKITCQDTDSDGDGYVSCTVRDTEGEIYGIECSGALSISNGCRMAAGRR